MKKIFNNAGVATFQSELLHLNSTEQQLLIAQIRADFAQFMMDHFDLHTNQITQINNMTTKFKTMLAEGIASTWESGYAITFQKDTVAEDDKPTVKDVVIGGSSVPDPNNPDVTDMSLDFPFSVWICYRTTT